jgi:hypothetical protein
MRTCEVWRDTGGEMGTGCPVARCPSMADLQDNVRDELALDLRSLEAADRITDEPVAQDGIYTRLHRKRVAYPGRSPGEGFDGSKAAPLSVGLGIWSGGRRCERTRTNQVALARTGIRSCRLNGIAA